MKSRTVNTVGDRDAKAENDAKYWGDEAAKQRR